MSKYIIREVYEPDFNFYFDGDCFSAAAGDYCYNVFPIYADHRGYFCEYYSTINKEDFKEIEKEYNGITTEINDLENGYSGYKNIKEIMTDYNLPYNPHNAHTLKQVANNDDYLSNVCDYLKIKTGEKWECQNVYGYCQGDIITVVYCKKYYSDESAKIMGEMALGCGKEFSITFVEDDKAVEDCDTVYGYFVADCQAHCDEDYKKIVCEYEGINPETDDITLEMIESISTITTPVYRTA